MRSNVLSSVIALALATTFFQPSAQAQEADEAGGNGSADNNGQAAKETSPKELETVVVAVRKRKENAQKTPVSMSSFTGRTLEQRGVTNISEIGPMTPNVSFDSGAAISGSSNSATIFIRGVGQSDFNLTIDPGVGLYLDGVYISRSVGALLDTADIAQVDVLRGPQGTLFGKNTIGGAVVLTSRQPEFDDAPSGSVALTVGNYNRTDLKASVNLPVNQSLALQASVSAQKRDGYGKSLFNGMEFGDKNSVSGRFAAALKATDDLMFTLALDATRTDEHAPPVKLLALTTTSGFPALYNAFSPNAAGCATNPGADNCYGPQWLTDSPYTNWNSDPDYSRSNVFGASLTVDWDLHWGAFKSITAYRDMDSKFWLEHDGAPMLVINATNDYSDRQFSQEFQLTGNTSDDRFKWATGLYYLRETGTDHNTIFDGSDLMSFLSGGSIRNTSKAVYAQGTYAITDKFGLTLGARYSDEEKTFRPDSYFISNTLPPEVLPFPPGFRILPYAWVKNSKGSFTPAATLDYKFSDGVYGYLTYSEGFKAGGFTQRVFPFAPEVPTFQPEYVKSFEAGLKTRLFDNRLVLNFDVFNMKYTDMQQTIVENFAPTIRNAGEATIRGFELEFQAVPTDWLELNGGIGYTDASYDKVDPLVAGVTVDSTLPNTPRVTATLGATAYVYENTDHGSLNLRLDTSYKGSVYKDAINTPELYQPGYTIVNASANFEFPNQDWSLSLGVTNLTDKRYLVTGYADLANAGSITGIYARPREWYARLKYEF